MKSIWQVGVALVLATAAVGAAHADPHGHRHYAHGPRVGIGFAVGPMWSPWYYPPPVYYPSYTIIERVAPPVYVEQASPQPGAEAANYWYFCRPANAYYPYVKECAAGWERVPARPDQP